jgi:RNA polymerase nonessential primary-like sigma factor
MLKAIEDFDTSLGLTFSNLLKVYVRQHLNRLYNEATRQKRYTGSLPDSLDRLQEINKERGSETDSTFTVECEDISSFEFMELLSSLNLNDKEQVAVNVLMAGGTKGEVAKALSVLQLPLTTTLRALEKSLFLLVYVSKNPIRF